MGSVFNMLSLISVSSRQRKMTVIVFYRSSLSDRKYEFLTVQNAVSSLHMEPPVYQPAAPRPSRATLRMS